MTRPDGSRFAHLTPRFRESFPTWSAFRGFVAERSTIAEFNTDRGLHQIVAADFAARLMAENPHDWLLFGSLALPMRPSPVDPWPADFLPSQQGAIDPAYALARAAFDLDLCALDIEYDDPVQSSREYGDQINAAVARVTASRGSGIADRGLGLGGLVVYSADVSIHPTGKVMGVVTAQPIDPRYGSSAVPVDDPIALEIDIKPPNRVRLIGAPDTANRPFLALELPGFTAPNPAVYPTVSQLADKITMISGPPPDSARRQGSAPWHRYKDVFDIYYMVKSCRVDAGAMREALRVNNLARFGRENLPDPYFAYGQQPADGVTIPWHSACEAMRAAQPELARYPPFQQMEATARSFVTSLALAPYAAEWQPGRGWSPLAATPGSNVDIPPHTAPDVARMGFAKRLDEQLTRPPTTPPTGRPKTSDSPPTGPIATASDSGAQPSCR